MRWKIILLIFYLVFPTNAQEFNSEENNLKRYALTYVFFHYGLNTFLKEPLKIVNNTAFLKTWNDSLIILPIKKINYIYTFTTTVEFQGEDRNVLIFNLFEKEYNDTSIFPEPQKALLGPSALLGYHEESGIKDYLKAAEFFNSLFKDNKIDYEELKERMGRTPYLFDNLEDAFHVLKENLKYIRCKGGAKIMPYGIHFCSEDEKPHNRIVKFDKLKKLYILDFLKNNPSLSDTTHQNNVYLTIERQFGEGYNNFFRGDSIFVVPIIPISRKFIEKAFQLEDVLIFIASS